MSQWPRSQPPFGAVFYIAVTTRWGQLPQRSASKPFVVSALGTINPSVKLHPGYAIAGMYYGSGVKRGARSKGDYRRPQNPN
jgi:hypothetical protein